jgi:hypothetical protein
MGDAAVVPAPLGAELAGGLDVVSGTGGAELAGAGGAVGGGGSVGGGGGGEHATSIAPAAKGAISIKRRRVAGDTMMMSLAGKRVVKIALLKTLQMNGLRQE